MIKLKSLIFVAVVSVLAILIFPNKTEAAAYDYQYISQSSYPIVKDSQTKPGWIRIKNTGTSAWNSTGSTAVKLGTSTYQDRHSVFSGDPLAWEGRNRIAMTKNVSTGQTGTYIVQPGQIAEFSFNWSPFTQIYGTYRERFTPMVESVMWMQDAGIYWDVTVPAPVGVFFFNWYDAGDTRPFRDTPQFGTVNSRYDSSDENVMRQQLNLIRDAGFEFVVIDWWSEPAPPGPGHDHALIRQRATTLAEIIDTEYPTLKFTFLQEPNAVTWLPEPVSQATYDYFFNTYSGNTQFMQKNGKLWLPTFDMRTPGNDSRFVTQMFSSGKPAYPDYWNVPVTSKNRISTIIPRFDNRQQCEWGLRTDCIARDVYYTEGLLDTQIGQALNFRSQTDFMLVAAWNEDFERTNIEPRINNDHPTLPADYSYQKVKSFINHWNTY